MSEISMNEILLKKVTEYIDSSIGEFHNRRLKSLNDLKLHTILRRKNPYLFKAKNVAIAADLVQSILDAHLSSQEETIFGEFLENLAIYICSEVYGGGKSSAAGIDLEFEKDGVHYIVSIKSGPNWANNQQLERMIENFNRARRTLRTSNSQLHIEAVNGCCYGKDDKPDKKHNYIKLCGQRFWEFISGEEDFYLSIIEPLGVKAKEKNDAFYSAYCALINRFTKDFSDEYCTDGDIDWIKLLEFNSGK